MDSTADHMENELTAVVDRTEFDPVSPKSEIFIRNVISKIGVTYNEPKLNGNKNIEFKLTKNSGKSADLARVAVAKELFKVLRKYNK